MLGDLVATLVGVESRTWHTVRDLSIRPGTVVRNYVDGQRARYVNPLRYAFVGCALWRLVVNLVAPALDPATAPELKALLRHGQWLNFALLPVLAVPLWLAFAGERFSYVDHLCGLLFCCGHVFLWRSLVTAVGVVVPAHWAGPIQVADGIVFLLYLGIAITTCHWRRARLVVLRTLVALGGLLLVNGNLVPLAARWLTR
jgi:hypothetical protein